jgi:hypothetical protein
MATRTEFTQGRVVMHSTRASFPGPKEVPLRFAASFEADGRWRVERSDFGDGGSVVIPDIDSGIIGNVELVVTLSRPARGTVDLATGMVRLDARFDFDVGLRTSTLALKLDSSTHTLDQPPATADGAPVDAGTGAVRLAGKARFVGGWLGGDDCLVLLDGVLLPNPRA